MNTGSQCCPLSQKKSIATTSERLFLCMRSTELSAELIHGVNDRFAYGVRHLGWFHLYSWGRVGFVLWGTESAHRPRVLSNLQTLSPWTESLILCPATEEQAGWIWAGIYKWEGRKSSLHSDPNKAASGRWCEKRRFFQ